MLIASRLKNRCRFLPTLSGFEDAIDRFGSEVTMAIVKTYAVTPLGKAAGPYSRRKWLRPKVALPHLVDRRCVMCELGPTHMNTETAPQTIRRNLQTLRRRALAAHGKSVRQIAAELAQRADLARLEKSSRNCRGQIAERSKRPGETPPATRAAPGERTADILKNLGIISETPATVRSIKSHEPGISIADLAWP